MYNVIRLPFLVGRKTTVIMCEIERDMPCSLRLSDEDAKMKFDSPVRNGDFFKYHADTNVYFDDEATIAVDTVNDARTIVEGRHAALCTTSEFHRRWRFGSILINFTVGMVRANDFSEYVPHYAVTIEDVITSKVILSASFNEYDILGGFIPRSKMKLCDLSKDVLKLLSAGFRCDVTFDATYNWTI